MANPIKQDIFGDTVDVKEHIMRSNTPAGFLRPILKDELDLDCVKQEMTYDLSSSGNASDENLLSYSTLPSTREDFSILRCRLETNSSDTTQSTSGFSILRPRLEATGSDSAPSTSGFFGNRIGWNMEAPADGTEFMSFICDQCGKKYDRKISLQKHISKSHGKQGKFSCSNKMSFTRKQLLTIHSRIRKGDKVFACIECEKSLRHESQLTIPSRIHCGENPFSCIECKKSFSCSSHLKIHTTIHSGEKPVSCTECQKSFRRKDQLKIHSMIHSGEKPFFCTECQKTFKTNGELTNHSTIHSGEKLFYCTKAQFYNAGLEGGKG